MWRVVSSSALGGSIVMAMILLSLVMLTGVGASFGEALYLSVAGLVVIGYAVTSWRLWREK